MLTISLLGFVLVACGSGSAASTSVAPANQTPPGNSNTATVTLTAVLTSVAYNASTTISWTSTNTTSCTSSGGGGTGTTGSFKTGVLTSNTAYTVTCVATTAAVTAAATATASQTITITVASSSTASAITAFAPVTGNVTTVMTLNTLANGTQITISGPNSYNGTYTVTNQTGMSFDIAKTFVTGSETQTGVWYLAGGLVNGCTTKGTPAAGLASINLLNYKASRYSGVAPLAVTLDASDTTTDGTITKFPFHEIEYQWDFGDYSDPINKVINPSPPVNSPSPDASTTTWKMGSKLGVNSRNAATGPVAAHVFETPGVYTVALTATDGTNTVKNSCVQIVVQDPNVVFSGANTICFSGATGAAAFAGCPANATQITLPIISPATSPSFDTAVNTYIGTGKRLLFHAGEVYAEAGWATIGVNGPGIIGMYGTGARPKILPASSYGMILGNGAVLTMQDWRVMDLEFDGSTDAKIQLGVGAVGDADQITFLRLNIHDTGAGVYLDADALRLSTGTHIFTQFTIADSTFTTFRSGVGWYFFATKLALLGNLVSDTAGGTAQHVVRIMHSTKGVISNNTFGYPNQTKQTFTLRGVEYNSANCLTLTGECLPEYFPYGTDTAITKQTVISDNHFISGNTQQPVTIEPSNGTIDSPIQDIIMERNWYTATPGGSCCLPMLKIQAQNVTVRNEIIDITTGDALNYRRALAAQGPSGSPAATNVRFYNNTLIGNDSGLSFDAIQIQAGATNISLVNNIFYSPKISGTVNTTNAAIASNNSTTTTTSPNFAAVSPTSPADFKITTGSYAIGKGAAVPVWSDYFQVPLTATSTRDMGAVIH